MIVLLASLEDKGGSRTQHSVAQHNSGEGESKRGEKHRESEGETKK